MIRTFVIIMATLTLVACGNGAKRDTEQKVYAVEMPEIPAILTTQSDRAQYVAIHFWDNFDFADTTFLSHNDVLEQAFADYIAALGTLPADKAKTAVHGMLQRALPTPAMFGKFTELYEHYLYDPNSPARNEELYIPVLEFVVASDKVDELDKLRPRSQLELALKNRVGQKAADIAIRLANGAGASLYGTAADYTILYINNPDCTACAEITDQLVNSPITQLLSTGRVKVFAVYPDEDITAWRNHLPSMPSEWINGYEETLSMRDKETYDIRAIPSLYLLDKDKTVLIKDAASVAPLEQYFVRNGLLTVEK